MSRKMSHVDSGGKPRMVDVSGKTSTLREAEAAAVVTVSPDAFKAIQDGSIGKGDVLAVAQLAGIQAAKRTAEWIPLCHTVPLDHIAVDFELDEEGCRIEIRSRARARAVTGVEMECLVAVSAAAVALYDMIKAVDRAALIGPIGVIRKQGGRSGSYVRPWPPQG